MPHQDVASGRGLIQPHSPERSTPKTTSPRPTAERTAPTTSSLGRVSGGASAILRPRIIGAPVTSVEAGMAPGIPVTVVPASSAAVAIETFMTGVSRVIRNCPAASGSRTTDAALALADGAAAAAVIGRSSTKQAVDGDRGEEQEHDLRHHPRVVVHPVADLREERASPSPEEHDDDRWS